MWGRMKLTEEEIKELPTCNFCGKTQAQVRRLVCSVNAYICEECVDLAYEVIHASKKTIKPHQRINEIFEELTKNAPECFYHEKQTSDEMLTTTLHRIHYRDSAIIKYLDEALK